MGAPWEKYGQPSAKPWEKYGKDATPAGPTLNRDDMAVDDNGIDANNPNINTTAGAAKVASVIGAPLTPITTIANAVGMPKGPALSDAFPSMYSEPGKGESWYSPEKGGLADPTVGGTITGAADMLSPMAASKMIQGAGSAIKMGAGAMSGLTAPSAEALAQNPELVNGLAKQLASGQTSSYEKSILQKIKDAMSGLQKGSDINSGGIEKAVTGQQIPVGLEHLKTLAEAGDEGAQKILGNANANTMGTGASLPSSLPVEGPEAYRMLKKSGQLAYENGTKNPLTGAHIADDPAMGAAWKHIRGGITAVAPEVDSGLADSSEAINLRKELASYQDNPTSILTKNNVGKNATLDRLAKAFGQTDLQEANTVHNAAQEINGVHSPYGGIQIQAPIKGVTSAAVNGAGKFLLPKAQGMIDAAKAMSAASPGGINPYSALGRSAVNEVENSN